MNKDLSNNELNVIDTDMTNKFTISTKNSSITDKELFDEDYDLESTTTNASAQRPIKPRHLFLVSIGTGVGTGMLVSTGSALRQAGPANLIIAYILVSSFIFTTYNSISELAVVYKNLSGSYNDMFKFLIDP